MHHSDLRTQAHTPCTAGAGEAPGGAVQTQKRAQGKPAQRPALRGLSLKAGPRPRVAASLQLLSPVQGKEPCMQGNPRAGAVAWQPTRSPESASPESKGKHPEGARCAGTTPPVGRGSDANMRSQPIGGRRLAAVFIVDHSGKRKAATPYSTEGTTPLSVRKCKDGLYRPQGRDFANSSS